MFMHGLMWLQLHSVIVVTVVFAVVWLTTYWPGRRESIERHGRIPLDER
jgi:cbb3-type cytochrome oxidase subunit 3